MSARLGPLSGDGGQKTGTVGLACWTCRRRPTRKCSGTLPPRVSQPLLHKSAGPQEEREQERSHP